MKNVNKHVIMLLSLNLLGERNLASVSWKLNLQNNWVSSFFICRNDANTQLFSSSDELKHYMGCWTSLFKKKNHTFTSWHGSDLPIYQSVQSSFAVVVYYLRLARRQISNTKNFENYVQTRELPCFMDYV